MNGFSGASLHDEPNQIEVETKKRVPLNRSYELKEIPVSIDTPDFHNNGRNSAMDRRIALIKKRAYVESIEESEPDHEVDY